MLGPSGSGKTTTLRMIAGFELPTRGPGPAPRRRRHAPAAVRPRREHGLPGLRPVPAHDRRRQRRRTASLVRKVPKAERARRVGEALDMVRLERLRQPQARPAVGRPAPARRPRPGARQPAAGPAPRRAARRARPEAPRGDADRAEGDPAAGRDHVHLRDPRPGGGAHDERPAGRLQPRPDRAGRARRPRSTSARRPRSSPASSAPRTCSAARSRRGDRRRRPARSRSGPRRSAWPSRSDAVGADETSALGHDPERRLPRPRHPVRRRARRGSRARRHPAEPRRPRRWTPSP